MSTPPVPAPRAQHRGYPQPRLKLDDLLGELQLQLNAVLATRDRMYRLLEAVVSVGQDLDVPVVLRRIIEVSMDLIDAEFGALGVLDEDGTLGDFITVGVSEQQQALIGPLPRGHGLLGELIRHPVPLRLSNLGEHPEAHGFPPNHPPMKSFIGVPIRVRDEVFGNLYFTEKRGGLDFDDADMSIVEALAAAAGVAIANARMYELAHRREQYLRASTELTTSLLNEVEPKQMMQLLAQHSLRLTRADVVAIALPTSDGLLIDTVVGAGQDTLLGRRLPYESSIAGEVFSSGKGTMVDRIGEEPNSAPEWKDTHPFGPMLFVPLTTSSGVLGILMAARFVDTRRFGAADRALLDGFSGQAAVALERAQQRADLERMQRFEERDEIAREMHEVVVQRLFKVLMKLDGLNPAMSAELTHPRIREVCDELDETIRTIRDTIYEPHQS